MSEGPRPEGTAAFRTAPGDPHGPRVLEVFGEVDVASSGDLRSRLGELVDRSDVVVDLSGLTFIDSSGLGVLIGALRRAREHGHSVRVRGVSGTPRRVFEITGLDALFALEQPTPRSGASGSTGLDTATTPDPG